MISEVIKKTKFFGIKVSFLELCTKITANIAPNTSIHRFICWQKHHTILAYLKRKYCNVIASFSYSENSQLDYNKTIWLFWWQGIDKAPLIVKKCWQNIQSLYADYKIIVITKNNISEYITLENVISEKVKSGKITLTHLSDIVRMRLLDTYGGMWMDSTIFLSERVSVEKKFITLHLPLENNTTMVSEGKWCGFFIGGIPNALMSFANQFFLAYWEKEEYLIDYFLIDYVIRIGYDNIPQIQYLVDGIKENNSEVFKLQSLMNLVYSETQYLLLTKNTHVHKLSYKEQLTDRVTGKATFYGRIIKGD